MTKGATDPGTSSGNNMGDTVPSNQILIVKDWLRMSVYTQENQPNLTQETRGNCKKI